MKGFPKNASQLDPQAMQRRMQRIMATKRPESCIVCDGTIFSTAFEIKLVGSIEAGTPLDVIGQDNLRYYCIACLKPWKAGETKEDEKEKGSESAGDNGGEGQEG